MSSKFVGKLTNFQSALDRLKEAIIEYNQPGASDVVRDGVIQRFEFTYELAWKTIKAYLEYVGIVEVNSPRSVIREGYAQKLIDNEENWILMLDDRNLTVHMYKEEIIEEIAERITGVYVHEFALLLNKMKKKFDE